ALQKEWEDGLSAHWETYEPLQIFGEALKAFILSQYGQSALILPIHYRSHFYGSILLLKEQAVPFTQSAQRFSAVVSTLLALFFQNAAEYAETKNVNLLEQSENITLTNDQEERIKKHVLAAYETTLAMLSEEGISLTNKQRKMLYQINDALQAVLTEIPPFIFQSDDGTI
ncbi:MAG: hypothetical protein ACPL3P_04775, partial [Anaerolineales bacterium]